jgi:opacity protein-like surface antigen
MIAVDASFGDILKNLGGALMGTFEAKYGRFILFNDFMYTKLKPEAARAVGPLAVTVNIDSTTLSGLAAAGYRVIDGQQFSLDVFAGVRGFYMDNNITVLVAAGPFLGGQAFGKTKSWLDAVGGMRMRYQFDEKWFATAIGFAGGGASKYQWDLYGGAGYSFNQNWAAFAGYRALKVNYQDNGFIYDILQHGPLFGVQYRW